MDVSGITPAPARGGKLEAFWARTLGAILRQADSAEAVHKSDLGFGDRVLVTTRNSVYCLWALADGRFAVCGGWFDKQALSPATVGINGCTYGGSVIRHDIIAARGLFLEFGNNVSTTRIRDVRVLRWKGKNDPEAATLPC